MAITMERSKSGLGDAAGQRSCLGRCSGDAVVDTSPTTPSPLTPLTPPKAGPPLPGSERRRKPSIPNGLNAELNSAGSASPLPAKSNSPTDLMRAISVTELRGNSQPNSPAPKPKSQSRRGSSSSDVSQPNTPSGIPKARRPSNAGSQPSSSCAGDNGGDSHKSAGASSQKVQNADFLEQVQNGVNRTVNDKDKESKVDKGEDSKGAEGDSAKSSLMKRRLQKPLAAVQTRKTSENRNKVVFKVLAGDEKITDFFETNEQIYEGGSKGKVMRAKRKGMPGDQEDCVLKIRYKKGDKDSERVWRTVMEQLITEKNSVHVLDIHEVFEDDRAFYIIMPHCTDGELFEFLLNETEVPETECKRIIREILFALHDLHSKGLIHRDVKPENIMFSNVPSPNDGGERKPSNVKLLNANPNGGTTPHTSKTVKLIDFDTCQPWSPESPKIGRFAGTPGYIAPESLIGHPGPESDLYSVGIILYILMTGDMPWNGPLPELENAKVNSTSARRMYDRIKSERFDWETPPWPDFPQARDLCQKLLEFEPTDRIATSEAALKHPWLRER